MNNTLEHLSEEESDDELVDSSLSRSQPLEPRKEILATLATGLKMDMKFKGNEKKLLKKMMEVESKKISQMQGNLGRV